MIVLAFWLLSAGLIVGAWTALLGRRAQVSHFGLGATILCFAGLCLLLNLPFAALAEIALVGGGVGGLFFTAERWLGKGVLARGDISWFLLLSLLLLGLGTALVSLRSCFEHRSRRIPQSYRSLRCLFPQPQIRLAAPSAFRGEACHLRGTGLDHPRTRGCRSSWSAWPPLSLLGAWLERLVRRKTPGGTAYPPS